MHQSVLQPVLVLQVSACQVLLGARPLLLGVPLLLLGP